MVELQPDTVGILEQQRIISRRPLILARRANDGHAERAQKTVQFIDVGALAGAKTQMVQADACLLERRSGMLWRRLADPERGASADAVIEFVAVDHRLQADKGQQFAVEFAGAFEIRRGENNVRDAVDFHRFALRQPDDFGLVLWIATSIPQSGESERDAMNRATSAAGCCGVFAAAIVPFILLLAAARPANAAGCAF